MMNDIDIKDLLICDDLICEYGCEKFNMDGYSLIVSDVAKDAFDVNQIRDINVFSEPFWIKTLDDIENYMSGNSLTYSIHTDFRSKGIYSGILREKGYNPIPVLIQGYSKELSVSIQNHDIRIVDTSDDEIFGIYQKGIKESYAAVRCNESFPEQISCFFAKKLAMKTENYDYAVYICINNGESAGRIEVISYGSYTLLANLYVGFKYRNKGIASELVLKGIEHSQKLGKKAAYLATYAFDTPRYLYSKLGFVDLTEKIMWIKENEMNYLEERGVF